MLYTFSRKQASVQADKTAIADDGKTISYAELEEASNQLAALLITNNCHVGDRICLLMQKKISTIVSILAVLKAGCAYVPLDHSLPTARLESMIISADPKMILVSGKANKVLAGLSETLNTSIPTASVDESADLTNINHVFTFQDIEEAPTDPISRSTDTSNLAYILFTSGSTGTPKGVAITHANVLHFVNWAVGYFKMTAEDKTSGFFPLHFDLSVFDIFCTFAAGAQLHLVPAQAALLPNKLTEFIRHSELTQWFSVPSILTYMAKFDSVKNDDFPHLKKLLWCGEVFPVPSLIYWMKKLPHVEFSNLYGPTEATIASSCFTLTECPADEKSIIPIGKSCSGEELIILDKSLSPIPCNSIGDLYIKGVGLSPGYWHDEKKTHEVFLQDPESKERIYKTGDLAKTGEDGLVYFIGREDSQIKSRGYRIELGEIETATNALSYFSECAIVAIDTGGFEGTAICLAYVLLDSKHIDKKIIRQDLANALPAYMLPSLWREFERLPKNINGKIDRKALNVIFSLKTKS